MAELTLDEKPLRTPTGRFQAIIRRLAEAAMAVTHHDIDEGQPEYTHEMQSLEIRFTSILRGQIRATPAGRSRRAALKGGSSGR